MIGIKKLFLDFFTRGQARTIRTNKNIAASFVIKGASIVIGLMLVPLTINYLEPTKYGIWITLSSIIGWFGFFDIGLGHGLRNKFAEALATGKQELARNYVSTAYAILSLIIGSVLVVFFLINPFLNWEKVLNVEEGLALQQELTMLALVVFTFFCLRFVFKLITTILKADQRPAKASLFDLIGKVIALMFIFVLTKTTEGSLIYLGMVVSGAPVFVLLVSNIYFFKKKYRAYKPSIKHINFKLAPDLLNLGVQFFILQAAGVFLFKTNNIIITQILGPAEVTPYNVAFKYFSLLLMVFTIIVAPFWSAFTEAWVKKEINWIKQKMNLLIKIWGIFCVIALFMLLASKSVFGIWIGDIIKVPYSVSALTAGWVIVNCWNSIFSNFLNGLSKVRLQIYLAIVTSVVNVPLAILMGLHWGIEGILLSNIIVVVSVSWVYPIQYMKIINQKDYGIWSK